jgi:DNA polymerase-3 subunit delta'
VCPRTADTAAAASPAPHSLIAPPAIEAQPHARAVLMPVLEGSARPSHAYLFHGPAGTGKRETARAFAAALLAHGAGDPEGVAARARRGSHPDLTWVTPSGATEMLVADIEEPVVAAAARTPFESSRRVFVIEAAHTLNDQAANRMLKTLEEPASFVHVLLLSERPEEVLPTIASRCQHVRFDPLPPARIAAQLHGPDEQRLLACSRLALGDAGWAAQLAGKEGAALRASAEAFVRSSLAGATAERLWLELLERARAAGARAAEEVDRRIADELELVAAKERKRHEREGVDARRRVERRARTRTLDHALGLVELWLRDLLCIVEGAPELIHAVDRRKQLEEDTSACAPARLREGIELVADTRMRLALNVSEELALEALAYRLEAIAR